jgi:hypothetical protein
VTEPSGAIGEPRAHRGRAIAFWVLGAIILLGPIYGHFFATGSAKYLGWKMFSRKATNFCAVEFTDAKGAQLDRYAVLKAPRDARRSAYLKRLRDVPAAERIGKSMCKAIGEGAHVALTARCARPEGWSPVVDKGDLCRR